jgi:hypothetical protein
VIRVLATAQLLEVARKAINSAGVTNKFLRGDVAAESELRAASLLLDREASVEIEFEPEIIVGEGRRVPDFRIRLSGDSWTYVEVTRPDPAREQRRMNDLLPRFRPILDNVGGRYSLELFFQRAPLPNEVPELVRRAEELCRTPGPIIEHMPDAMGTFYLNQQPPGVFEVSDHGEPSRPGINRVDLRVESSVTQRQIAVRLPYLDSRASAFLKRESRQLSPDSSNLVMIDVAGISGSRNWPAYVESRLQPTLHTRIGGVCVFSSGQFPSQEGEKSLMLEELRVNPYANRPLPQWAIDILTGYLPLSGSA